MIVLAKLPCKNLVKVISTNNLFWIIKFALNQEEFELRKQIVFNVITKIVQVDIYVKCNKAGTRKSFWYYLQHIPTKKKSGTYFSLILV